jgi:hypothetical protein
MVNEQFILLAVAGASLLIGFFLGKKLKDSSKTLVNHSTIHFFL